ncbi:MAG: hypothetical protein JW986_07595 [Methanotrichaceae archaeon]|nr:hypothetical protein [Methanotrichaceae archaeon]
MILLLGVIPLCGCVGQDGTAAPDLPRENLPMGFSFRGEINASTPWINMTEELEEFYGANDIGAVNGSIAYYVWGEPGVDYDAKITIIETEDEAHALAAVENFRLQPKYEKPPFLGVDRFGTAQVGGRDVLEIRDKAGRDQSLRYSYLWNAGETAILVEGNGNRTQSLELASTIAL